MDYQLKDQHVLITGAAGGIGAVTAEVFLKLGAKVTFQYHSSKKAIEPLLSQYPKQTYAIPAEVLDENSVIESIRKSVAALGPINILVANHANYPTEDVPVVDMKLSQWKRTLDVNLTGYFLFVREYLRQLRTHASTLSEDQKYKFNANIILVCSTAALYGEADHADYSASKSAIMYGFMRSLKNEIVKIVPRGRVNSIQPGWVHTAMAERSIKLGKHFKTLQTIPLKKIATPHDCAYAIIHLASQVTSGHTSGGILTIDGGMEGRVLNSLEEVQRAKL